MSPLDAGTRNFSFAVEVSGILLDGRNYEDILFEAGCDDALVCVIDGKLRLSFDREAASFESAVAAATRDIQKAGGIIAYVDRLS
jgi:hypothetical protein